jgi:hypothetical protein
MLLQADSPLVTSVAQLQHDIRGARIFEQVRSNTKVAHLLSVTPGDTVPSLLCVRASPTYMHTHTLCHVIHPVFPPCRC